MYIIWLWQQQREKKRKYNINGEARIYLAIKHHRKNSSSRFDNLNDLLAQFLMEQTYQLRPHTHIHTHTCNENQFLLLAPFQILLNHWKLRCHAWECEWNDNSFSPSFSSIRQQISIVVAMKNVRCKQFWYFIFFFSNRLIENKKKNVNTIFLMVVLRLRSCCSFVFVWPSISNAKTYLH